MGRDFFCCHKTLLCLPLFRSPFQHRAVDRDQTTIIVRAANMLRGLLGNAQTFLTVHRKILHTNDRTSNNPSLSGNGAQVAFLPTPGGVEECGSTNSTSTHLTHSVGLVHLPIYLIEPKMLPYGSV